MEHLSVSPLRTIGSTRGIDRDGSDRPIAAQFTVRRDTTSRSDGRVTDVVAALDGATPRTGVFLANPTAGPFEPAMLAEFARGAARDGVKVYADPRDLLLRVDDLLHLDYPGVYMTALFASVAQHDHVVMVSIANRGHVLPIVICGGTARAVGFPGSVLGPRAHRHFRGELSRVALGPGDQLLLINDRPADGPMPQPHRPGLVSSLPLDVTDDGLADHVMAMNDEREIDVIVISGSSG